MHITRRRLVSTGSLGIAGAALALRSTYALQPPAASGAPVKAEASSANRNVEDFILPRFTPVQPELFSSPGAQTNCWADFDADGDLDLFVGFKAGYKNRLYRNDAGIFAEVGEQAGIADLTDTRGTGWGDFDADGRPDLLVGFSHRSGAPAKLYHNEGKRHVSRCCSRYRIAHRRRGPPDLMD